VTSFMRTLLVPFVGVGRRSTADRRPIQARL